VGTNKGTNQRAGSGDRSNRVTTEGVKSVKKAINLTEKKAGPMDYLQKGKTTGFYAVTNGRTNDMYGGAASKATDDYLVSQGKVKVGNYFKKVGGEFIKISKKEGEKLYAKGDPSISRSTIGDTKSKELKYGKSNTAMGSGDPTGIMTSTQISQPMFESQKKMQGLVMGAMALGGIPLAGSMLLYNSRPGNNYSNYLNKFYSTMSSSGIQSAQKNNQQSNDVVSNNSQVVDQTTKEKDIVTTSKFKKKKASQGDDSALANARSLFKKTGQTITGSMA
tara:strand:- start:4161 stop:4991 length:831 start_codon:yes stop_codon:yes gene_type:complete